MGFLDPNGSLGRQFGSIGVALEEISTRLTVYPADKPGAQGPQSSSALRNVESICSALKLSDAVFVDVEQAIPDHVGLGSGTQMSLAVGMAISKFYGLDIPLREIASLADRGARSGIGIGVFEQGGLIVDGGRSATTMTPPVVSRMAFPPDWRFILVFDERAKGLNGNFEVEAFQKLPAFPQYKSAEICHRILMQGLPAVAEHQLDAFGEVITFVQRSVGDYFAPAQGGRFMSADVQRSIHWLGDHGAVGLGQSSWGPTGFCMVDSEKTGEELLKKVQHEYQASTALKFRLVSARNQGGMISTNQLKPASMNLNSVN